MYPVDATRHTLHSENNRCIMGYTGVAVKRTGVKNIPEMEMAIVGEE